MIKAKAIRVKLLDKIDFQRLFFEVKIEESGRIIATKKTETPRGQQDMKILYVPHTKWCLINIAGMAVSAGYIKNFSELQRELTRIGVKEIFKADQNSHAAYPLFYNDCDC